MELKFIEKGHKYQSVDDPERKWLSTTGIIGLFKEPFDQLAVATKSSKNKKSKWYGMRPGDIIAVWDKESKRASDLGTWYHNQREKELLQCQTIQRQGIDLQIIHPIEQDGVKFSPDQNLIPGIYPEHFVYLKSANICGQADRVEVVGDEVNVYDYKTNKKIDLEGYTNWEGVTKKLSGPLSHLDDCNFMHYAIQLSMYMYIILKHNHSLKPGKMEIHHVKFEVEGEDEYGYPINATDAAGDPLVKEVIPYEVPYLKSEVVNIIKYLKTHPELYD